MLFRWFAEERVEVALVEVGLGGRLDATHAWDGGVAAITNVALDHMAWLGDTIPAIAREKAAIIERGDLAVTGATGEALDGHPAPRSARRRAAHRGGPPPVLGWDRDGIDVQPGRPRPDANLAPRSAPGRERRGRGRGARRARGGRDRDRARRTRDGSGYGSATWPGRLELIRVDGRDVLLDGAHNPAGAAALALALDDLRPFLAGGGGLRRRRSPSSTARWPTRTSTGSSRALDAATALRGAHVIATQVPGERALAGGRAGPLARGRLGPRRRRHGPAGRRRRALDGPSTWPAASAARSSSQARCTSSARRAGAGWTTRCCGIPEERGGMSDLAPAPTRRDADRPGTFRWGERTSVMGILNVTPDSFSGDGLLTASGADVARRPPSPRRGRWPTRARTSSTSAASRPARAMRRSTRTRSWRASSRSSRAVRAALPDDAAHDRHDEAGRRRGGARRGRRRDQRHLGRVGGRGAREASPPTRGVPIILMHNRAEPRLRGPRRPRSSATFGGRSIERSRPASAGADILDRPGDRVRQDARSRTSRCWATWAASACSGRPILLGTSRKSTLGKVLDLPAEERVEATVATTALGIAAGVDIVRVHDVRENVRAARMADAMIRGDGRSAAMSDRIVLAGMAFQARHGVNDWEKVEAQRFEVDVELEPRRAAAPASTTTWRRRSTTAASTRRPRRSSSRPPVNLIEALAEAIAHEVLAGNRRARRSRAGPEAGGPARRAARLRRRRDRPRPKGWRRPGTAAYSPSGRVPSVTSTSISSCPSRRIVIVDRSGRGGSSRGSRRAGARRRSSGPRSRGRCRRP